MKTAEEAVVDRAPDGVSTHDMGAAWRVVIARFGERSSTWYHNVNDDPRIALAHRREADRRYAQWAGSPKGTEVQS